MDDDDGGANGIESRDDDDIIDLVTPAPNDAQKQQLQSSLKKTCKVLKVSQRKADWFLMRQFHVTGTNAGKILLSNSNFRSLVGLARPAPNRTQSEWASIFV